MRGHHQKLCTPERAKVFLFSKATMRHLSCVPAMPHQVVQKVQQLDPLRVEDVRRFLNRLVCCIAAANSESYSAGGSVASRKLLGARACGPHGMSAAATRSFSLRYLCSELCGQRTAAVSTGPSGPGRRRRRSFV